jgi:tetratricopeptide (TPR) repeat protein
MLRPDSTVEQRAAFAREFLEARALEERDAGAALGVYRLMAVRHPEYAELHYRIGRLLLGRGRREEAAEAFELARDLDGLPQRFPGWMHGIYRDVAAKYGAILVDGPAVLRAASPSGALDDGMFHDGQHPSLRGHVVLAQAVLDALAARGEFGWPSGVGAPVVDVRECAAHFGVDSALWGQVCSRAGAFYDLTAYIRHDATERMAKRERYRAAARRIYAGESAELVGVRGVGVEENAVMGGGR